MCPQEPPSPDRCGGFFFLVAASGSEFGVNAPECVAIRVPYLKFPQKRWMRVQASLRLSVEAA
jgi:hypothetical protein